MNAQGGMTSFGWDDVTGERHVTGAEPSTRRRDKKVAGQRMAADTEGLGALQTLILEKPTWALSALTVYSHRRQARG